MRKLNIKKVQWIVKEVERREMGVYTIAKLQKITPRWARELPRKYKGKEIVLKKPGRRSKPIPDDERKLVIDTYNEYLVCATMIERILDEKGIHIGHNRTHRILLEAKLAKEEQRKKNRRKWVRYERKHSNSLWHTDWFEYKGKQCIIYLDDASRFIPSHGEFDNANTDNSLKVFKKGLKYSIPKQLMSDHGTQFENQFMEKLREN